MIRNAFTKLMTLVNKSIESCCTTKVVTIMTMLVEPYQMTLVLGLELNEVWSNEANKVMEQLKMATIKIQYNSNYPNKLRPKTNHKIKYSDNWIRRN
jgi:hypothetical protein